MLREDTESDLTWPPSIPPPPSIDELVTDDGEPLESNRHRLQMTLLIETLEFAWASRNDFFVGGNMFLYYSALQAKKNDFRGPDVFVVLGTERRDRKAWVIWEENGKRPDLVVELTSDSTRAVDYGDKKRIYGSMLGIPEYYIYDPLTGALDGFHLDLRQNVYIPVPLTSSGRLPAERLGLELGPWQGSYQGFPGSWLRWYRPDGHLLPTAAEAHAAEAARREEADRQRAAEATRREEADRQRAAEAARREEAERQRAAEVARREEAERQRAAEAARREEAEARLRTLEAELAALRRGEPGKPSS